MGNNRKVLGKDFFGRTAEEVAPELLGKYLVCWAGKSEVALPITEVEIYDGENDEASHAHKGRSKRTEVMFWEGGHWYVYLVYGMYEMLNIVVGEKDYPAAVLIRGAGEYDGPGKLTKALKIDRKLNQKKVEPASGLWLEDRGVVVPKGGVQKLPRVGINYAGEPWRSKKWRYILHEKSSKSKNSDA